MPDPFQITTDGAGPGGGATSEKMPLFTTKNEELQRAYKAVTNFVSAKDDGVGDQGDDGSESSSSIVSAGADHHGKTDAVETFLHLVKGYMGAGCLSLPWAVSQLGITFGIIGIIGMSVWSSYNCWIVVQLKRYMERTTHAPENVANDAQQQPVKSESNATNGPGAGANTADGNDDAAEVASVASSNITYPDVGDWAYGARFQKYVTLCICTQQLAICTVFVSFVGENLLAVLVRMNLPFGHTSVMTLALPVILGLSLIPSLKLLAPVMATGFVLLLASLAALGVIVVDKWSDRPDTLPTIDPPQIPLALCAILYSYEGINLILPVESVMRKPEQFAPVFCASMAVVAAMLSTVGLTCVYAFGNVTSGSVTAFLLDAYKDDDSITLWLMIANTAVSLSVLLTYPLQLFPALELLGPMMMSNKTLTKWLCLKPADGYNDDDDQQDLTGFEPMPPLPEHGRLDEEDMAYESEHHKNEDLDRLNVADRTDKNEDETRSYSGVSDVTGSVMPQMNAMPGDSIQMRILLVLLTYIIAVVVPNVQSLISLAGALAGSSTALLIPPVLELAWMEHLEKYAVSSTTSVAPGTPKPIPKSPHVMRRLIKAQKSKKSHAATDSILKQWFSSKYWAEQLKCYVLLFLGTIFMIIGTYSSLADIVRIYIGKE